MKDYVGGNDKTKVVVKVWAASWCLLPDPDLMAQQMSLKKSLVTFR